MIAREHSLGRRSRQRSLLFEGLESRVLFSLAGVPVLNSNPGATNTIYMDFDSQTFVPKDGALRGTSVTLNPFNFDSDLNIIGPTESQMIEDIHARLSEDFAPFDVNVTTVKPQDPNSKGGVNQTWWVAFSTIDTDAGFPLNVDASGNPTGQPSGGFGVIPGVPVVWTQAIGGNTAQCACTAAHELGHQFGLRHHVVVDSTGVVTNQYSPGPAGDDWSPIMGNNLQARRSIWWNQSYATITEGSWSQNDMQTIAGKLGWRADDHGDAASTATALGQASPAWTLESGGVIGTTSDVDAFLFIHPGGDLHIEASALAPLREALFPAANLDARLELRSATGASLNIASDPVGRLGATIQTVLPAGAYVVQVGSHGDYGDVGQYTLSIDATTMVPDRFDDQTPVGEPRNDSLATAAAVPDVLVAGKTCSIGNLNLDPNPASGDVDFFRVQVPDVTSVPTCFPGVVYHPSTFRITVVPDTVLGAHRDFEIVVYQNGSPSYVASGEELTITHVNTVAENGEITFSVRDPDGVNFYAIQLDCTNAYVSSPELLYDPPLFNFVVPALIRDPVWFGLPYTMVSSTGWLGATDTGMVSTRGEDLWLSDRTATMTVAAADRLSGDALNLAPSVASSQQRDAAVVAAYSDFAWLDGLRQSTSLELAVNLLATDIGTIGVR